MRKYLFFIVIIAANYLSGFSQSIVLRGTIITPSGVMKHGYVSIVYGRIASVSDKPPNLPGADTVNTHGIILPGFVDVHNHVVFNVLPRWSPGRLFTNRNQWRTDPERIRLVSEPVNRLEASNFCDMNAWGEFRALVGGTTSLMVTRPQPCIHGLVRNLDFNSGFYGTTELNREHIFNVLDLPSTSNPQARAAFVDAARFFIANPFYEALLIHLAEGTDDAAKEEFTFVQLQSLLNPKGVVIHGIPLGSAHFQAMATNGTALVWSPRSNLELYGQTANVLAALDAGVEIALAPDWAVTGSSNILDELKVAARWNREQLGGRLTDRQLINMVTSTPARIAGVDDHVGALKAGLRADILVINGDHNDPYRAVVDATVADIDLVFIGGVPIYGDRTFMEHFWKRSDLQEINLTGTKKTLATPSANIIVSDIETRLKAALDAEGISLAPLIESDAFEVQTTAVAPIPHALNTFSGKLTVTTLPNPSGKYFTIRTQSSSNETLQLKVLDVSGRIVEARTGITANTTIHVGNNFRVGIYFVEVVQGKERQVLKLIRQ
jgi:5-methylthioadenosine/S-adenosylhomocysteine deaminase